MKKSTLGGRHWTERMFSLFVFLLTVVLVSGNARAVAQVPDQSKETYSKSSPHEANEESIHETKLEYIGEIGLDLKRQFSLDFNEKTPGIGEANWIGVTRDNTLLLTDRIGERAHEFDLSDGRYIQSFGRQGRGPGEYGSARYMSIDPQGMVYLLDSTHGQIVRYDRAGKHVDTTRLLHATRVLTGRLGEVFVLMVNPMKIMELRRLEPSRWDVVYRVALSTNSQRFISYRMKAFAHLCYSVVRNRLYFLGPNDYMVREIDAETGKTIRRFGRRPKGYVPLPTRYHGIEQGSREDMRGLKMTTVRSMTIVHGRFLIVSHINPGTTEDTTVASITNWSIYDLDTEEAVRVYDFSRSAKEHLESEVISLPWNSIASSRDQLYVWSEPSAAESENSNGNVAVYALDFGANN